MPLVHLVDIHLCTHWDPVPEGCLSFGPTCKEPTANQIQLSSGFFGSMEEGHWTLEHWGDWGRIPGRGDILKLAPGGPTEFVRQRSYTRVFQVVGPAHRYKERLDMAGSDLV